MTDRACPWHVSHPLTSRITHQNPVLIGDPARGPAFYARDAAGRDIELGRTLAKRLRDLITQIADADMEDLLAGIPPAYRDWLTNQGYEPAQARIEQQLTDLILNRGRSLPLESLLTPAPPRNSDGTLS